MKSSNKTFKALSPETAIKNEDMETTTVRSGEEVEETLLKSSKHKFGYGSYQPPWLQVINNPKCLLFFVCCCAIVQGMIVSGLVQVSMSTFEKRFYMTKFRAGLMTVAYEVAVSLVLLPIAHYGERGRKSTWIGCGMLLMGSGSLICASAQFVIDVYEFGDLKSLSCPSTDTRSECSQKRGGETAASYLIVLGQFMHGIGAAPLYTLGVTFLDENVPQTHAPFYMGVFYGTSIVGPALGYIIGGASLNVYGDLDKADASSITITPDDPRWYGAWWMGFILSGTISIILVCPVIGFSRHFKDTKEIRRRDWYQYHDVGVDVYPPCKRFKDTIYHIKYLCVNWTWLALLLMKCADWFLISGFNSFFGTLLENFHSFSSTWSHMIAGAILIPGGFLGNLAGGFIVSRFKMNVKAMLLLCLVIEILALVSVFGLFAYCSDTKFVGVTAKSPFASATSSLNRTDSCNIGCNCGNQFNPVCHSDSKLVYFSPCYAGCSGSTLDEKISKKQIWANCTCLPKPNKTNIEDKTVVDGFCTESCTWTIIFLLLSTAHIFFTFSAHIPALITELRCVHFDDRTLAISLSWIIVRLFGTIPGTFMYRWLVDSSCILWDESCAGSFKCLRYDPKTMAGKVAGTGAGVKLLVIIFIIMGYKLYKPVKFETPKTPPPALALTKPEKSPAKSIVVSDSKVSSAKKKLKNNQQAQ